VPLVFTSTNKIYGGLEDIALNRDGGILLSDGGAARANGINELRPLHLHSPYGCSKGAADQYIIDYARTFGLPAVVFRMSCIYGSHQIGNGDQGWVAHFLIHALDGQTITLYGDGNRCVMLSASMIWSTHSWLARAEMPRIADQAFNIGGGPEQAISLLELMDMIGHLNRASAGV
jgi:CDP-paratose 2-epimerase